MSGSMSPQMGMPQIGPGAAQPTTSMQLSPQQMQMLQAILAQGGGAGGGAGGPMMPQMGSMVPPNLAHMPAYAGQAQAQGAQPPNNMPLAMMAMQAMQARGGQGGQGGLGGMLGGMFPQDQSGIAPEQFQGGEGGAGR